MSIEVVKSLLVEETNKAFAVASARLGKEFKVNTIRFDLRGRWAGAAHPVKSFIQYNLDIALNNWDRFLPRTPWHEAAHIVAAMHFGKKCSHGPEWKWVMEVIFKKPAIRCHDYDIGDTASSGARKRMRHIYFCRTCKKEVSTGPKHHKIIQSAVDWNIIRCCKCNQIIRSSDYIRSYNLNLEEKKR